MAVAWAFSGGVTQAQGNWQFQGFSSPLTMHYVGQVMKYMLQLAWISL